MKILHVYKVYLPENFTGVPRVIFELSEQLAEVGVHSAVLASGPSASHSTKVGSHVAHIAKRTLSIASTDFSIEIFSRFRELLPEADLVHFHFPWPVADLLNLVYRSKKPYLVTYHSDIVKQRLISKPYAPLMHHFLAGAKRIVATSPQYRQTSKVLRRYLDKVDVIPIGISERPSVSKECVEKWRSKLGEDFFLFVGALRYYKGTETLVGAANFTTCKLVIAGAGSKPDISQQNLVYLGEVTDEDKEALLTLSRALVFPSNKRSEAFGISLLEASRAAKPMITCEIGTGTSYVNKANHTGLVINPNNSKELATAISTLSRDPQTAAEFGANARKRFDELFSAKKMAAAYLKLYEDILSCPLGAAKTPISSSQNSNGELQ